MRASHQQAAQVEVYTVFVAAHSWVHGVMHKIYVSSRPCLDALPAGRLLVAGQQRTCIAQAEHRTLPSASEALACICDFATVPDRYCVRYARGLAATWL